MYYIFSSHVPYLSSNVEISFLAFKLCQLSYILGEMKYDELSSVQTYI